MYICTVLLQFPCFLLHNPFSTKELVDIMHFERPLLFTAASGDYTSLNSAAIFVCGKLAKA